ncbi:hypothetical protein GCM10022244_30090 [Streptomyces gulbargensis]|uniref:Uncharacterized protein n=1 Tax=Streptomyces gulbargensis TaxID=364901 RepID=A0ABP7MBC0_9ACTN
MPALDLWNVLRGVPAAVGHRLCLMVQPPGLPEALIGNSADVFYDAWAGDPVAEPEPVRSAYLRASAAAVPSIVADFRASAGVDVAHDRADQDAGSQPRPCP